MKRNSFCLLILFAYFLSGTALGQPVIKTSTVKGSITIGGKPTADAVVSVEGLPQEYLKSEISGLKSKKAVLDQRDMKFIPRVLAAVVGSTVDFPNNDTAWHNVFSTSEAKKFDLGLYPPKKSRSVAFDKTGVVKILCNVHPNMEAYVVVKSHTYVDLSDARGNYTLSGVPLGKYRVEVWHPKFGTNAVPVELVREGEVLAVDIELKNK